MEDVGIRLSLAGRRELAAGLDEGTEGFEELERAADDAGKAGERSGRRFERTRSILGSLGRGLLFGVKAAGAMAVAGAAVGLKTAAGMQTARIGFTTMLGSARKADSFLRDLGAFAARTPFEFPELQTAASSLVSAGVETKNIIPMMTTLGDVTAGMGTGSEGIKRATNALQQMNAAGKISAEDLNQLRDAGIPVYDLLAAALGKTKAEVAALKDEGKLGADALGALQRALVTGKGLERFNGLMAQQSKSLTGRWSTLKDTVTMGLAGAVEPIVPIVGRLLGIANRFAAGVMPKIESGLKSAVPYVRRFLNVLMGKGGGQGGVEAALATFKAPGVPSSLGEIGDALGKVGDKLEGVDWASIKDGLGEGTVDLISVGGVVVGLLADHIDELAQYLPFLVAGLAAWKVAQAAGNIAAVAAVPLAIAQTTSNFALAGAMRAQTAATTTATVAQKGLTASLLASPLTWIAVLIVAVGAALYLAYQRSETFRGIVDTVFGLLKDFGGWLKSVLIAGIGNLAAAILRMGAFGVKAFGWLLRAAFMAFDGILSAAEHGLGWVPGLGDKIKGARAAFNEFGDSTIAKLDRVEAKLRTAANAADKLGEDRDATISITTVYNTRNAVKEHQGGDIPGVANGGHVKARRPYIVGERRAELFIPSVSGMIRPQVPSLDQRLAQPPAPRVELVAMPAPPPIEIRVPELTGRTLPRVPDSPAGIDDLGPSPFGEDGEAGPWSRGPRIVQIMLDRRVLAEAVLDEVGTQAARR